MQYFGLSNKGRVREGNEDFFHVPKSTEEDMLFIVADGMGGENAGEVASSLAVSSTVVFLKERSENDKSLLLRKAINYANKVVFKTAQSDNAYSSMGTTMVCALIEGDDAYVANVGDSRCYVFYDDELQQITIDHSFVQEMVDKGLLTKDEAKKHPNKNLITRAIGISKFVNADVFKIKLEKGMKILLSSDGLTGMVDSADISEILRKKNCRLIVEELIEKANDAGGIDNITAVLICND